LGGGELLQQLGNLIVWQPLKEHGDFGGMKLRHKIRPLGRTDDFSKAPDAIPLAFPDQRLDVSEELSGLGGGHDAPSQGRSAASVRPAGGK
jgi:hypothetical protein